MARYNGVPANKDEQMNPTVAIVAQGAMGAGVGARLVERGLRVITSLAGRSEASAARAKKAGMVAVSDEECVRADLFLSICPPSEARALAERMAVLIAPGSKKPVYVDCNAVSPPTKVGIGDVILKAGAPFVDVGIIGLPPKEGTSPFLHASGPDAAKLGVLNDFGIKVNVIEGRIGAASALKMSYAGITKGTTALGSMMMLAATRAGVADRLRAELDRSHPALVAQFQRAVPEMFDKAYRFVGEMEEIADFVGEDEQAHQMYQAIAEFYTRIAADQEGRKEETGALAAFLKKR
jgi:3-hydroxyisobutyrate dehydrogenase-like beta-hydroxyacid dehydrogenase